MDLLVETNEVERDVALIQPVSIWSSWLAPGLRHGTESAPK